MGVYFSEPTTPQPAIGGQTSIPNIVNVFASRLARAAGLERQLSGARGHAEPARRPSPPRGARRAAPATDGPPPR